MAKTKKSKKTGQKTNNIIKKKTPVIVQPVRVSKRDKVRTTRGKYYDLMLAEETASNDVQNSSSGDKSTEGLTPVPPQNTEIEGENLNHTLKDISATTYHTPIVDRYHAPNSRRKSENLRLELEEAAEAAGMPIAVPNIEDATQNDDVNLEIENLVRNDHPVPDADHVSDKDANLVTESIVCEEVGDDSANEEHANREITPVNLLKEQNVPVVAEEHVVAKHAGVDDDGCPDDELLTAHLIC